MARNTRQLHHLKGFRVKTGNGPPSPSEGSDGEITLRTTRSGLKLFVKFHGKWYTFGGIAKLGLPGGSDTEEVLSLPDLKPTGAGSRVSSGRGSETVINTKNQNLELAGNVKLKKGTYINRDGVSKQGLYFGRDDVNKPGQAYFDDDVFIQKGYKLYLTDGNLQTEADGISNASWIIAPLDTVVQHVVDGNVYLELDHTNGRVKSLKQVMLGDNGYMVLNDNEIDVSSGNLTLDVAGNIALEAGGGEVTMDAPLTITNTNTPQLKLIDQAGEYAQMAVTGSGDLTITTVGSGTTDSDINLTADGNINLSIAAGELIATSGLAASWAFNHANRRFRLYGSDGGGDYLELKSSADGVSTISTVDSGGSVGNLTLDIDGAIKLDSHSGRFIAAKAGIEFSAENSAYAGMILGATYIAPSTADRWLFTSSWESITSGGTAAYEPKVSFVFPPSGKVMITCEMGTSATSLSGTFYMGLATDASATTLHTRYEHIILDVDETDTVNPQHSWMIVGTAGVAEEIWIMVKQLSGTGRINFGGAYGAIQVRAIALPDTVYDGT